MSTALTDPVKYATLEHSAALSLNPRQISFVDNYLEVKTGWKAAELAGYSGDRPTLCAIASENLRKPRIYAYYLERLKERQIGPDEILAEVGEIAKHTITPDSPIRPDHKLRALELAGKHHRLFADRVETELELSPAATERLAESLCQGLIEPARKQRETQLKALPEETD